MPPMREGGMDMRSEWERCPKRHASQAQHLLDCEPEEDGVDMNMDKACKVIQQMLVDEVPASQMSTEQVEAVAMFWGVVRAPVINLLQAVSSALGMLDVHQTIRLAKAFEPLLLAGDDDTPRREAQLPKDA